MASETEKELQNMLGELSYPLEYLQERNAYVEKLEQQLNQARADYYALDQRASAGLQALQAELTQARALLEEAWQVISAEWGAADSGPSPYETLAKLSHFLLEPQAE